MSASIGRDLARSGGARVWMPDAPLITSHAKSDRFLGPTLDPKWAEWDPAGYMTVTVDATAGGVLLTGTGNGSDRLAGIHQPVSGSEFAFIAKVGLFAASIGRWSGAGIFLGDSTLVSAPTTADVEVLWMVNGLDNTPAEYLIQNNRWNVYSAPSTLRGSRPSYGNTHAYLRMRVNGTNVSADFSSDGMNWIAMGAPFSTFTASYFGVVFNNLQSGVPLTTSCQFIEVFDGAGSSAMDASRIGRAVTL